MQYWNGETVVITISFFSFSETLTMILCKMSQDTEGSYRQLLCRNLSRTDYCHLYNIPFHVLHDWNKHKRQYGLSAAEPRSDQESRWGFSAAGRTRWWPQVTQARWPDARCSPPRHSKHDPARQKRSAALWFHRNPCTCAGFGGSGPSEVHGLQTGYSHPDGHHRETQSLRLVFSFQLN